MGAIVTGVEGFAAALAPGPRSLVALVGGGGKTTLLFALGRGLAGRRLLTTTTRMGGGNTGGFPTLLDPSAADLAAALGREGAVVAWRSMDDRKALGFAPEVVDGWFEARVADHVAVEADGARRRPFTAPAPREPPIPGAATCVVACIGADALGYVIADLLHRPLRVAAAANCSPYERLTPARAAAAITSPVGMGKNVPEGARFVAAVTKADPGRGPARDLAGELDWRGVETILVTAA